MWVGLSTGQSGSGLCPTRNRPDHFGSPKLGLVVDPPEAMVWVVGRRRFPIGFQLGSDYANRRRILPKSAFFCWIDRISKRSQWILKRSNEISKRQRPRTLNQTKIPSIRPTTIHNLVDFFPLFAKGSWPLSDRLDKIRSANYFGESYFQWIFRLGWLKIGFPCSNLSTDPSVLGFGGEDSLPTIIGIGSAGLGGWVG